MALDIGRIAYQAYIKSIEKNTISEFVSSPWEEIGKVGQDAWREVGVAVLQYLDQEKIKEIILLRNRLEVTRLTFIDADKDSISPYCLGCGHERDESHKDDCLLRNV
jgi:hypothetical protein